MKFTKISKFVLLFIGITLLVVLFLVVKGSNLRRNTSHQDKVAVTIFPIYNIVKNIAGNELKIVLILPPGASPHTFDPTPRAVEEIQGSMAIFSIGHGLDNWTTKLADASGTKNIITLDKHIDLLSLSESQDEHKVGDDNIDPHYWLSVPNAIAIASQVKDELSLLFPEKSSFFEEHYQNYKNQLIELDIETNQIIGDLASRDIATFHSAWNYFARDHKINIVATFEEFPGKQPTPKYLAEFQEKINKEHVKIIFSEPQFSILELKPIAKDLDVTIATLDPIGGVEGRESFIKLIRYNVNQLEKTLK